MRNSVENFRALALAAFLTQVAYLYVGLNIESSLSVDEKEILSFSMFGALIPSDLYFAYWIASHAAYLIGYLGLFFFLGFGRWLVIFPTVSYAFVAPFTGWSVYPPIDNTIWAIHQVFFIFVVGMAFFSLPVRARFARKLRDFAEAGPYNPRVPNKSQQEERR